MSTYHYSACHTCRVVWMIPKTSTPEEWHKEWVEQSGHVDHEHQCASEHDQEFEARTEGKEITGYCSYTSEAITKKVTDAYKNIDKEMKDFQWRDE